MTRFVNCTLALLLLAPAAWGQEAKAPPKPSADPKAAAEMTEDVEVLRLLLNKAFGFPRQQGGYPGLTLSPDGGAAPAGTPGGAGHPTWLRSLEPWQHGALLPEAFDGVYLKGHGIAYTIRLSTLTRAAVPPHEKAAGLAVTCQNCHAADAVAKFNLAPPPPTAGKPLTDWEKARNELRGVASPAPDQAAAKPNLAEACVPGNLTEAVTKLLAANGRNLRHLPADESVSVVITYEGVTGSAQAVTGTMADPAVWNAKPPAPATATPFGLTADESKQIVLGDLHLKQGKPEEAIKAYEAALARYVATDTTISVPKNMKMADVTEGIKELHKNVTGTYRSLAQAYLAVGNFDEAKRAIDLAQRIKIELSSSEKRERATPVPAKIILTVKKAHLDAAEKLSPADFRKGVGVEIVGMTATKK